MLPIMQPTPMSVAQLVAAALTADDDASRWDWVMQLQYRDDDETFAAVKDLCADIRAEHRVLGVDIAAKLGVVPGVHRPAASRRFHGASVVLLLNLAATEEDPRVIAAIATAFGHLADERSVATLASWRAHPDAEVRHGVAYGLAGLDNDLAWDALIDLSADPVPQVRDWATFALARQTAADFPRLRAALADRLDDVDVDVRLEAIHGLATRGDRRAVEPLLALLADPDSGDLLLIEEALGALIAATNDPRLIAYRGSP